MSNGASFGAPLHFYAPPHSENHILPILNVGLIAMWWQNYFSISDHWLGVQFMNLVFEGVKVCHKFSESC